MIFKKSDLKLTGYKDTAQADHDNPYYTKGADHTQLNRMENYEVAYFINHLLEKKITFNPAPTVTTGHKIERMIRVHPGNIRSHLAVEKWIQDNFNSFTG